MKVSVLQENLHKGLNVVGRAVAARTTLPIASNVLLATDNGQLRLAATDTQSISLTCWVGAQIEEEGRHHGAGAALDGLRDVAAEREDRADAATASQAGEAGLRPQRGDGRRHGRRGLPADPGNRGRHDARRSVARVSRPAINQVVFAAALDDSRPVLTGVDMIADGSELTLAAADGFRLAVRKLALKTSVDQRIEIIVPARALAELGRLLGDTDEAVEMRLNEGNTQVLFKAGQVEMVAAADPGHVPELQPAHSDRVQLTGGRRGGRLPARDERSRGSSPAMGLGIVRLQVATGEDGDPGKMSISAKAEEIGDNLGEIDAAVEGEASKIAFNGKYLQEVLQVLEGGQVALETTSPSSPGVMRPVGSDRYVHVVMPMFVQW